MHPQERHDEPVRMAREWAGQRALQHGHPKKSLKTFEEGEQDRNRNWFRSTDTIHLDSVRVTPYFYILVTNMEAQLL